MYYRNDEDDLSLKNRAISSLRQKLYQLNDGIRFLISNHLASAVENVISGIRYERLQADGPKLPQVTDKHPLVHRHDVLDY
jgi:hypothetical protein